MPLSKPYVYSDLGGKGSLVLSVADVEFEVTEFAASFKVNDMPTASCALAVGRSSTTGAAVHQYVDKLKPLQLAQVRFHPVGEFADGINWPGGTVTVFEGYFLGFSYTKLNGKMTFVAQLVHWLIDLASSSLLTAGGHPMSPMEFNVAAAEQTGSPSNVSNPQIISAIYGVKGIFSPTFTDDFWGGIKNLLCDIGNREVKAIDEAILCAAFTGKNERALSALKRIEGPSIDYPAQDLAYKYGLASVFDRGVNGDVAAVVQSIVDGIGNQVTASYSGTTFWDKLITGFCPDYGLAMVPLVGSALVVPYIPGYQKVWKTIPADEQESVHIDSLTSRPLRAVGVIQHFGSTSGAIGEGRQPAILPAGGAAAGVAIAGCFMPKDDSESKNGVALYVEAPPWLINMPYSPSPPAEQARPNAVAPGAGPAPVPIATFGDGVQEMFNRFAHTYYIRAALDGRGGQLQTKLRFDIAPGSSVRLEIEGEKGVAGEDALATHIYATAQEVTISISAEAPSATTNFALGFARTEAENKSDRTSTDRHPLFTIGSIHGSGKHGAPLIPKYEFK